MLEESHALPLVDFVVALRAGATGDPEGREGLTRVAARLVRRGVRGQSAREVDERLATLGARLSVTVSRHAMRFDGTVLARNLEPFVALLSDLLHRPAFRGADLARAKRRIRQDLVALRDDDGGLAARHLRSMVYGAHPYARAIGGTSRSLGPMKRADLAARWREVFVARNLVFGAAGAVDAATLGRLLERHFGEVPAGARTKVKLPAARIPKGRRLRLIRKPERVQTQLGIGTLSIRTKDPHRPALVVADTGFGGMYTSPLMQRVRAERGWSYSAYSYLDASEQRGCWRMWTHPGVENARACAALQLEMLDSWIARGPRADDVKRAKRYLLGSLALDEDTPARRLQLAMDAELDGFGPAHVAERAARIRGVSRKAAHEALAARIDPERLAIVAVGDDALGDELATLPGITDVDRVSFEDPF